MNQRLKNHKAIVQKNLWHILIKYGCKNIDDLTVWNKSDKKQNKKILALRECCDYSITAKIFFSQKIGSVKLNEILNIKRRKLKPRKRIRYHIKDYSDFYDMLCDYLKGVDLDKNNIQLSEADYNKALKVVNDLKFKIRNKVLVETHLVVNEGKNGRNPQFRLANEKSTLVVRLNKKKKSFSNLTESRKTIF